MVDFISATLLNETFLTIVLVIKIFLVVARLGMMALEAYNEDEYDD